MIGSLPAGFEHIPKPSPNSTRWQGPAYAHLNLRIDQLHQDDWDVRIFHWDSAWGWDWSTHFAHAIGGCIYDMVAAPTLPLSVPPHRRDGIIPDDWGKEDWSNSDWWSKDNGGTENTGNADNAQGGVKRDATETGNVEEPPQKA